MYKYRIEFNLKEIRLKKNLTQKQLARYSNLSQSHISDLENNVKSPTLVTVCKLANALQINPLNLIRIVRK
ncbi:XRE family transcriptional regulator (plasmid) [Clostridiaceae bacterium 14S0207]|nr:XRE family transcriptional regulator [Clostridiaceae bacterium 14S0207]